jgi:putative ubiquitin-RnfH superfamily antitoxin RatB of RatAB toxin-antitoxin module
MREETLETITVEVAYALPQAQTIVPLKVKDGTTAIEAVQQSGILLTFPEISLKDCKIGIFGKITDANTILRAFDRVEIYRPLIANPKEARRLRAAANKAAAKSGQQKQKN